MTGLYKPRLLGTLKAAVAQLVDACGGLTPAADRLRKSKSQVQRYTDDAEPTHSINVDDVRTLETVCGEPIVTGFLAHEQGAVLLRLPRGNGGPLNMEFALVGERIAALFGEFAKAQGDDGKVDAREAARLLSETDTALDALGALRGHLQAQRE